MRLGKADAGERWLNIHTTGEQHNETFLCMIRYAMSIIGNESGRSLVYWGGIMIIQI